MNTINKNKFAEEIYLLLLEEGFPYYQAQLITAQAAHETGNFTSELFKKNNNCFGMKDARLRPNTQFATDLKGYAVYKSLADCIKDFALYYKTFRYFPVYSSVNSYVDALKSKGYFEANKEEYLKAVTYFHNLYFATS